MTSKYCRSTTQTFLISVEKCLWKKYQIQSESKKSHQGIEVKFLALSKKICVNTIEAKVKPEFSF